MPPRKRSSPEGANSKEHWLRSEEPARSRPWAYEELLFGSSRDRTRRRELGALLAELASERVQLVQLHRELAEHLARIDRLQAQLNEFAPAPEQGEPRPVLAKGIRGTRAPPPGEGDSHASLAETGPIRSARTPQRSLTTVVAAQQLCGAGLSGSGGYEATDVGVDRERTKRGCPRVSRVRDSRW